MKVQAGHQLHAMILDGLGTDFEDVRDLFGVLTFGDELENFALAARQLFERIGLAVNSRDGKLFVEPCGNIPPQVAFRMNRIFQRRLCLFGSRLGLLGPDFSLFRTRLCPFCAGFGLLRARLGRFGPRLGLLGARLGLFGSDFGLLHPRLGGYHKRVLILPLFTSNTCHS